MGAAAQPISQQERGAIEFGFYHVWDDTGWRGERTYAGGRMREGDGNTFKWCVCVCVFYACTRSGVFLFFFYNHTLCSLQWWSAALTLMNVRSRFKADCTSQVCHWSPHQLVFNCCDKDITCLFKRFRGLLYKPSSHIKLCLSAGVMSCAIIILSSG